MGKFASGLMSLKLLIQHQGDQLQFAITHYYNINLFGNDLILHLQSFNITMEIDSPTKQSRSSKYYSPNSLQDVCFGAKSNYLLPSDTSLPSLTLIPDYNYSFQEVKAGWLEKKTLNSSWQKRFFILTRTRLLYYSEDDRRELKGCFNFASLIEYDAKITSSYPEIRLTVSVCMEKQIFAKTLLVLQPIDPAQFSYWHEALVTVLSDIRAQNYNPGSFPRLTIPSLLQTSQKFGSSCNFWNRLTITSAQLLAYASHLDILFLRSRSTISSVHRFFMRSQYDHVGLLLKDESERTFLLEAVSDKGVIISRLDNLLESISEDYEEIAYRKLLPKETLPLPLDRLEEYINNLIGKKYQLSLSKLLIGNDSDKEDSGEDMVISEGSAKQERTYFCSQLVADVYLKFGVLSEGKSSSYWPKDLQQNQLAVNPAFSLSPLMRVEFSRPQDIDRSIEQQ